MSDNDKDTLQANTFGIPDTTFQKIWQLACSQSQQEVTQLRREVAMQADALKTCIVSKDYMGHRIGQSFDAEKVEHAISNTQATAQAREAEVKAKALEEAANALVLIMADADSWGVTGVVDKPSGQREEFITSPLIPHCFDHTYIDQQAGACEDDYFGSQYFPLSSGKYLKVWFVC